MGPNVDYEGNKVTLLSLSHCCTSRLGQIDLHTHEKLIHVVLALFPDEISSCREQVYITGPVPITDDPVGLHLGGSGDEFNSITPMVSSTILHKEVVQIEANKLSKKL